MRRILTSMSAAVWIAACGGGTPSDSPPDPTTIDGSIAHTGDGAAGDASSADAGSADAGGELVDAAPGADSSGVPPAGSMSFFVTSRGTRSDSGGDCAGAAGDGGNYGGLAGADQRCQMLAQAAGAGGRTWRAYLSTDGQDGSPAVHARDRVGSGPWYNHAGALVAAGVEELHAAGIAPELMLDEHGEPVPRSEHDLLTGSDAQGRALVWDDGGQPTRATCRNWTSGDRADYGWVGHSDDVTSWNSSHASQCSQQKMCWNNGSGRIMCFAVD